MSIRDNRGVRRILSNVAILFLVGMFVSVQQVSSESVFEGGRAFPARNPALDAPELSEQDTLYVPVDTMEVYDLLYDEEDDRNIYKEIALFAIVAAAVGYFVVTLIRPDDEEVTVEGGKEPPVNPTFTASIPLGR